MQPLEIYKNTLTTLYEELTVQLTSIARRDDRTGDWVAVPPTDTSESADENTQADVVEEWNERRALMAQLEVRFHHIELAMKKLNNGTFGQCEICHDPIEPARLAANPASRTCQVHMERARELPL